MVLALRPFSNSPLGVVPNLRLDGLLSESPGVSHGIFDDLQNALPTFGAVASGQAPRANKELVDALPDHAFLSGTGNRLAYYRLSRSFSGLDKTLLL